MIASVRGRVSARGADHVVVDVGGVGLELAATRAARDAAVPGSTVDLAAHLVVREDALTLFGFADADERDVFRVLIGVSGVGPKLALAVVSTLRPDEVRQAVAAADVARLASVPGVGRKTAQRLVVDLRDRLGPGGAAPVAAAAAAVPTGPDLGDPHYAAREALVALGFGVGDAETALAGAEGHVEARVRAALARLGAVGAVR